MPKAPDTTPENLKPYVFHGIDLGDDGSGPCPFCGDDRDKFGVKVETGQFNCYVCGAKGNVKTFLRQLWERSLKETEDYSELLERRGYLFPETLKAWGVCRSIVTGEWLIPGFTPSGDLCQLYRCVEVDGKLRPLATKGVAHGLHGVFEDRPTVLVCEGPWDGPAIWEVMGHCKWTDSGLKRTGNRASSLLAEATVVAVPGCGVFSEGWDKLFAGKKVVLLYDSDHPRKHPRTGETIKPVGCEAVKRVCGILSSAKDPPSEIQYLCWGPDGYDPSQKSGYDVRDHLRGDLSERIEALDGLFQRIVSVPEEWLSSVPAAKKTGGGPELLPTPCRSYRAVVNAWRKAMKWTDGLDKALSVMLASSLSTGFVGEQLWVKVVSPPSCLDGETPIFDPVDGTTVSVENRFYLKKNFHVLTRGDDGFVKSTEAEAPVKYPDADIYEVSFASGKTLKVTLWHRVWDGKEYVPIGTIAAKMKDDFHYAIPTIEEGVSDEITRVSYLKRDAYYDFHVPETENYYALGFFHHNTGKTTLLEGLAVSKRYVLSKDSIRGFHDGWREEGGEDFSLASLCDGKTLAIKDGDTLLKAPNLLQILAEARALYDGVSRTHYRNHVMREYTGHRTTILLCGTAALREIDDSELGARFLDCVIMDQIDDDFEDDVGMRAAYAEQRNMLAQSNGKAETRYSPELAEAMKLTGGYVEHLRSNAPELTAGVSVSDEAMRRCKVLGKFVAHMRARPPRKNDDEKTSREFSARLVKQMVRLTISLAAVLNKTEADGEVMERVRQVALDTSRGNNLSIVSWLYQEPDGLETKGLETRTGRNANSLRRALQFMRTQEIGAVELYTPSPQDEKRLGKRARWRLTKRMRRLYSSVVEGDRDA